MNEEFLTYLQTIGMSSVLIERVETIYKFYEKSCPEGITTIFVTDIINEEGTRDYKNLWFFSSTFMLEADSFITRDMFDMVRFRERIVRWALTMRDYDIYADIPANDNSRLTIQINLPEDISGVLRSTRNNCDYLRPILQDIIIPNML